MENKKKQQYFIEIKTSISGKAICLSSNRTDIKNHYFLIMKLGFAYIAIHVG